MVLTASIFFNVLRLAFVGTKTGLVEKTQRKNTVLETLALDLAASHTQFAHRSYSGLKTPLAYAVGEKVLHIHPYSISRMIIYIYIDIDIDISHAPSPTTGAFFAQKPQNAQGAFSRL